MVAERKERKKVYKERGEKCRETEWNRKRIWRKMTTSEKERKGKEKRCLGAQW